jgi:signal transduction histidine kinase
MNGLWRRCTLRTRLMTICLAALALALAAGSLALYVVLHVEGLHRVDRAARASSSEVAGLIRTGRLPQTLPVTGVEIIQVLDSDGRVLSASANADRLTSILRPEELADARRGPVTVSGSRLGITSRLRVSATGVATGTDRATVVVAEPVDDLVEDSDALRLVLLVGYPALLVVFGLIAWRVIGATLRPVEALRAAADNISGTGREDRLPVPPSQDEIHALAATLNSMLDRLDDARDREAQFVADAAHELRSPLASLRMQVDVARRFGQDGEDVAALDELDLDIDRMSALVEDLLVLARLETGTVSGHAASADVHEELARVASHWPPVVLVEGEAGRDLLVGARPDEVARILVNLVGNAARYSDVVRITSSRRDDLVVLWVDDAGPGISPADRERAFERFTRFDEARDRESGGAGLGLALVRATVRARGGDVRLADSPLGGLRVEVLLPLIHSGGPSPGHRR